MRIGLLGGTFNPIHNAHIALAEAARERLGLERVLLIPTYIPPHKRSPQTVSAEQRYEMVRRAVSDKERLEASDVEITRQGTSYSVETVTLLKRKLDQSAELFFIIGADSLHELPQWRNIDELLRLAHFVIAKRPGFSLKNIPKNSSVLEAPLMDISSTTIRTMIREGRDIASMVPPAVYAYIEEKGLYRRSPPHQL